MIRLATTPLKGGKEMRSTMKARIGTQTSHADLCTLCEGSCQDPRVPFRHTGTGEVIYLVKPCPRCEGRGTLLPKSERDLSLV